MKEGLSKTFVYTMTIENQRQEVIDRIAQGKLDDAEDICREGFEETENPEFLYLLAVVKTEQKQFQEAAEYFALAIAALPDRADLAYGHGVALQALGDTKTAIEQWQRALALDPEHQDAGFNLGKGHNDLGREDDACKAYETLLAINPGHQPALYNLANLHFRNDEYDRAGDLLERLVGQNPNHLEGWINLGMTLKALGKLGDAEEAYQRALALDPDNVEAHWNIANLLLLQGRWTEGFAEYEWRLRRAEAPKPEWPNPAQTAADFDGKRVLLWAEQGVGDAIQFLRYTADVAERAQTVSVFCQPGLRSLVETCPGINAAIGVGDDLPAFDVHVPLCSLAHILGKTDPYGSWSGPYLHAPKEASFKVPKEIRKIGLVWGGNRAFAFDHLRSFDAETYLPLLDIPGTAFFSLQVGERSAAQTSGAFQDKVTDLGSKLSNFAETASIMASLDLIISSDTAVAHLAGAMGCPAWILLHTLADWRWLTRRTDSPWYPSLRLFRQQALGDWGSVIDQVRAELLRQT